MCRYQVFVVIAFSVLVVSVLFSVRVCQIFVFLAYGFIVLRSCVFLGMGFLLLSRGYHLCFSFGGSWCGGFIFSVGFVVFNCSFIRFAGVSVSCICLFVTCCIFCGCWLELHIVFHIIIGVCSCTCICGHFVLSKYMGLICCIIVCIV